MAVNMKLGIDVGAFKAGIADANAQIKSFDAQLKVAENTIKKYGDGETGLITKTNALNGKLETQRQVVKRYEQALKDMAAHGVDPLTKDYQLMQAAMLNAQASIMETEAALDELSGSQVEAAQTADQLTQSMNGISKKISLDQVVSGIGAITTGLENAARKAVDFGEKLFSVIMDSAAQADDIATLATRLGLTTDEVQQMQYVAARFEAPVESMAKTWKKVRMSMTSDSDDIVEGFKKLGVATHEQGVKHVWGYVEGAARNYKDVFWETGEALMKLTDASEQERLAQQLLGRSWDEMVPLFRKGRKEYEAAVKAAPVASKEAVDNMAELNDRMSELESSWNTLKLQTLQSIAPALTAGADAITKLLDSLTEYLKTDAGQELMTNLGNAVSALFEDLGNLDADKVVENFAKLFEGVVNSFKWLEEHWGDVKNALIGIAAGFGALKIATLALNIGKVVSGLGDLIGRGGTPAAPAAPSAAPGAGPGAAAAGEQIGTWMRLGVSSVGQWIGKAARGLSMYDPTGATALVPQVIEDRTTLGWELAHGASIGEAAGKSWETIKASAKEGMDNLTRYFSAELPNAFWGIFGFKSAEDAAAQVTKVAEQTKKNMEAADAYTFDEHMSIDEIMAMMNGEKPAEVKVVPKASITFNEDLLKQLGPFVIPANVAIVGVQDISGVQMNSFLSGMGFGSGGNPSPGLTPANFSSNLYVENMNMNNGMDAAGLAARMAAAQRRISAGYGN